MADDSSDAPSLETLPDEILRAIFIRLEAEDVGEAMRLFAVSRTLRTAARVIEELNMSSWAGSCGRESMDTLRLPYTRSSRYDTVYRGEASLLASTGWAKPLSGLRVLRIAHLSWGGAARLLALLPAWPRLEVLDDVSTYITAPIC